MNTKKYKLSLFSYETKVSSARRNLLSKKYSSEERNIYFFKDKKSFVFFIWNERKASTAIAIVLTNIVNIMLLCENEPQRQTALEKR
jgi:hypothetical protein